MCKYIATKNGTRSHHTNSNQWMSLLFSQATKTRSLILKECQIHSFWQSVFQWANTSLLASSEYNKTKYPHRGQCLATCCYWLEAASSISQFWQAKPYLRSKTQQSILKMMRFCRLAKTSNPSYSVELKSFKLPMKIVITTIAKCILSHHHPVRVV